jgi:hypothetical protein
MLLQLGQNHLPLSPARARAFSPSSIKRLFARCSLILATLAIPVSLFAGACPATGPLFWNGTGASWSTANAWSATSGGARCTGPPTRNNGVFFDANGNAASSLNVNVTVASVTFSTATTGSYSQTLTFTGSSLTVTGAFIVNRGTMSLAGNALVLNNGMTINGGIFNAGSSTVTFNSSASGWTIQTKGNRLNNVQVMGQGGYWTLVDSMTVSAITVNSGSTLEMAGLDVNTSSFTDIGTVVLHGTETITTVPLLVAGSTVTFNPTASTSGALIYSTWTYRNLIVNGAATTTAAGNLTVVENLTLNAGTLDMSTSNRSLTVGGYWNNTGATFNARAGEVIFNATSTGQTITSFKQSFSSVTFSGSGGGYWTLQDSMTLTSTMTLTNGTLDTSLSNCSSNSCSISIGGSWINGGGAFIPNGSTITWTAGGAGQRISSGHSNFGFVQFNGPSGYWTLQDSMTVTSKVTLTAGTLDTSANKCGGLACNVGVGGSWNNNGGTFIPNTSSVTFTAASAGQQITSGHSNFASIQFSGSGAGYWTLQDSMTVVSTMSLTAGTLDTSSSNYGVSIGGSWYNTNAAFLPNSSTVTFTATSLGQVIQSGGDNFGFITFTGSGGYWTLIDSMTVISTITIAAGTLDTAAASQGIAVGGGWLNSGGNFVTHQSTVTFTGSSSSLPINPGPSNFWKLIFAGTGSWQTASTAVTISSDVVLNSGALTVASGSTMTVVDDLIVNTGSTLNINADLAVKGGDLQNAGTIASVNTATLTVSGAGTLGGSGTSTLPRVTLTGSGQTTTLGGAVVLQGSFTINGSHTVDVSGSNYQITVSSDWVNLGTFNAQSGVVLFNSTAAFTGSTTFSTFTAITPGITLTMPADSTQTVNASLTIVGGLGNLIKLRSTTTRQTYLKSLGAATLTLIDVQYNNASGNPLVALNSNDSLNNTNWTFSTTRIWVGTTASWNLNTNWSPSGVPGINDPVFFNNTGNNPCTVDVAATVPSLTVQSGYTQAISLNNDLTITGTLQLGGGSFRLVRSTISVGGNWTNTGAVVDPGTGTVRFNGTAPYTITSNKQNFYNLYFNGAGGYWTLQDSMTVISSVTLTGGTLDTSSSNYGISVGNDWLNNGGAFAVNQSTLTFYGNATGKKVMSRGYPFYNVWINGTGGYWTLQDSMTVTSTMTLTAGTLDTSALNFDIGIGGGWYNYGGTFVPNGSTVSLTSASAGQKIRSNNANFANLSFNSSTGAGGYWTLVDSLTVTSTLTLTAGTLDTSLSNFGISVGKDWLNNGGLFAVNQSTVTFTGTTTGQKITTRGFGFYNVGINGPGGYWTLQDSMTVISTVTLIAGTLDVSASDLGLQVGGSWFNNGGTWVPHASTVTFVATAPGQRIKSNGSSFAYLQLLGAGGIWTLQDALVVNSTMTLTSGTLDCGSKNITVAGSWVNAGGLFLPAAVSTVSFTSSSGVQTITSGHSNFGNIQFNGTGGYWTLQDSMTVVSTVTLTAGTLDSGAKNIALSGSWWNVGGTFLANANTLTLAGGFIGQRIASRGYPFGSLIVNGTGGYWTLRDSITLTGDMTLSAGTFDTSSGNLDVAVGTNWTRTGATLTLNQSTITFTGSGSGSIANGGTPFYKLIFSGTGGSWQTATSPVTVSSVVVVNAGTLTVASGSTMTVVDDVIVNSGGVLNVNADLAVKGGDLQNAGTVNSVSGATLTITGAGTLGGTGSTTLPRLTVSGAGQSTTLGGDVVIQGSFTITGSHTLDTSGTSYQITLSSDWVNLGTFTPHTGTVLISTSARFTGNTTFNNLTYTTQGVGLVFTAGSTQTVSGTLTLTGATGALITLRSSASPSQYFLNVSGTSDISFVDVLDSKATGITLSAAASTNSGNNINWVFGGIITWNTNSASNWNNLNNWTPKVVPGVADSVLFNTKLGGCTIDITTTVAKVTINAAYTGTITANRDLSITGDYVQAGGTFIANNTSLSVDNNFSKTGGVFTAGTSTLTFTGSTLNNLIVSGNSNFYKVLMTGAGSWKTSTNQVTVTSDVVINNGVLGVLGTSTMTVSGDIRLASGGELDINSDLSVKGGNLMNNGTVAALSTATLSLSGAGTLGGTGTTSLPRVTLSGGGQTTSLGGAIVAQGSFTITASHTLDTSGSSYQITVSSDWVNAGTFVAHGSTVAFNGAVPQMVNNAGQAFGVVMSSNTSSGGVTFQNGFTATGLYVNGAGLLSPTTIYFTAGSTFTISRLTLLGASGQMVWLRPTPPGNQLWYLNNTSTNSVSYVDVAYSSAAVGITVAAGARSTDSGNNTNWTFRIIGVQLSPNTYDFGQVGIAGSTIATSGITVTNSGNDSETYTLSVATTGPQTVWGIGASTPTAFDTLVLEGVFNAAQPASSAFRSQHAITGTPTVATTGIYAGDLTGASVPAGNARKLWMKLFMPLTVSTTTQQTMNLTVTASSP